MSDHSGGPVGHHAGGIAGHHVGRHSPATAPGSRSLPTPFWPCAIADISRAWAVPPYAGLGSRAGAHLLDSLAAATAITVAVFAGGISESLARNTVRGGAVAVVLAAAALSWLFHNRYVRAGRTGQSLGKSVLRIRLVDERTGRPIGTWRALARDLVHVIDLLSCCGGYLMPLWDARRQTIADKVAGTLVVRDAEPPFRS